VDEASAKTGKWAHTYAALDLGTNNCRLLVARPTGDGFRVVDAFSCIVRLGEGLSRSGRLSEAAMRRTIEALSVCAGKMSRWRVTRTRNVATEACRQAANCEQFIDRVAADTGLELEIISSGEEAEFALAGCVPLLEEGADHAVMFDIGGGSTELMWLDVASRAKPRIEGLMSLPCGVVNFAECYGGDPLSDHTYKAMVDRVADEIAPFEASHRIGERIAAGHVQMLGTSGTVTTLAGVHLCPDRYDRSVVDGAYLTFDEVGALSRVLAHMDVHERAATPCIGRQRADLVVAGCAILEAICRTWPVGRLRVADRGLREGILLSLIAAAEAEAAAPRAPRSGSG
jgi:exopolyphosphatase/guanosine-5'-triphosphate,3'-diphosphate pyrophosphatase